MAKKLRAKPTPRVPAAPAPNGLERPQAYSDRQYDYGSYYVLRRAHERQLLAATLRTTAEDTLLAAEILGISRSMFLTRAAMLGGVYLDSLPIEPPKSNPRTVDRRNKAATKHAKRRHRDYPASAPDHGVDQPADRSDGEGLRDDGPREGGDHDHGD